MRPGMSLVTLRPMATCLMLPRLQLLRELLSDDGSIWVTIDDNEGHYLKVLMDEVFGRGNSLT